MASNGKIRSISYAKYGYMFILPFFLVYAFFQVYPLFNTFYLSFMPNSMKTTTMPAGTESVGLQNYIALLTGEGGRQFKAVHESFTRVLGNTVILWLGNFIPQIILSLLLAAWFTDAFLKIKGKGFYKIVMYMPNIITAASVAALFVMLFGDSKYGAINTLLINTGIKDTTTAFVSGENTSRVIIMFIQTWMWFGNTMIMLMSGIMGINPSLFEAASIDGATPTQQFFQITMPLLRPIMIYTLVTSMIGGLQMFDIPYLFNTGTAQNKATETVAVFIYNHFHSFPVNFGYAAAASVLLFIITAALGVICFMFNKDDDPRAAEKKRSKNGLRSKLGGI